MKVLTRTEIKLYIVRPRKQVYIHGKDFTAICKISVQNPDNGPRRPKYVAYQQ